MAGPLPTAITVPADPAPTPPSRRRALWPWLLLALAAAGASAWGWQQWRHHWQAMNDDAALRLDALEQRLSALRGDQRAQLQRLQQADATNRVLRDELLGIGQRAALLEESVSKLADPDRHGAQALRLDEAELLLTVGAHRLQIAGDLDGARRAYALAAGVLDGVDDPAYLSLRQTLLQERTALDALGAEPRVRALARLDAFTASLAVAPPPADAVAGAGQAWWQRAFGALVRVEPSDRGVAVQAGDRAAAQAALQLEFTLARAAAERRDGAGFRAALQRARAGLDRLWPESPALQRQRAQLDAIAAMPLSLAVPTLGTTLEQLRQMRASR